MTTACVEPTVSGTMAAKLLGCTHYRILKLANVGAIHSHVEMGSPIRYFKADVDRLLAERQQQTQPAA